ncbi:MAG: M15 family metallopeptidase [Candidatus Paceibacterota bacterium]
MQTRASTEWRLIFITLGATFVVVVASVIYLYIQSNNRADTINMLLEERNYFLLENASNTKVLEAERALASSTIFELSTRLSLTSEELEDIENDLRREKNKNDEFEDQLKSLAGTVGVLDKLSKTDKELLQKYSRTYFLNENFRPVKLSEIKTKYIMPGAKDQYFHGDALPFLTDMLDDALDDGHDLRVISAFRSFDEQKDVKTSHEIVYGSGANAFSADQGYSEHQLGTTLDIVDIDTRTTSQTFGDTEAFAWLEKNAYKYGFILSYPEGNTFYIYEPWHWRFVGTELATYLHRKDKTFYDLDQREIDTYLVSIFD